MSDDPTNPWNRNRFKGRKMGEPATPPRPAEATNVAVTPPAAVTARPAGAWGVPRANGTPVIKPVSVVGLPPASPRPSSAPQQGQGIRVSSTNEVKILPLTLGSPIKAAKLPGSPLKAKGICGGIAKLQMDVVRSSPRPRRMPVKGPISDCSPIIVMANHFKVKFTQNFPKEIFHYDVVIQSSEGTDKKSKSGDPSTLPDRILPVIWLEFERAYASRLNAATPFDGKKNCYTAKRLNFDGHDCFSAVLAMQDPDDPDKNRRFHITLKLVSTVPTIALRQFLYSGSNGTAVELPQDSIQALDVALRYAPSMVYTPCNRSFFSDAGPVYLNEVLDLWYGHYQSLCLGCDQNATLNIDLATKAFYKKMSVVQYLMKQMGLQPHDSFELRDWNDDSIKTASEYLKGKLIQYGTGKKTKNSYENYHRFTAVGLVRESSLTYKFKPKDGEMTIMDYMINIKHTKIDFPNYPVVHIGSVGKTNYVPLELCSIIPQAYRGKMEAALTKEMIKGAAVGPSQRFKRILQARDGCKMETCRVLQEFGLEIGTAMTEIKDSRRIHPPRIVTTKQGRPDSTTSVHSTEGKWKYEGPRQFLTSVKVPPYAVIIACKNRNLKDNSVPYFLQELTRSAEQLGMTGFHQKPVIESMQSAGGFGPLAGFSKEIAFKLSTMKQQGVKLVIVIIGDDGKEYAAVKAEAEVNVGILTACIKVKNVTIVKPQTIGNYLLKLNSKLGGTNFSVEQLSKLFFNEPIIVFGADVTHPAPNSNSPSIAAVTASYNQSGMGFNMHIHAQSSRQEVIDKVDEIVEKMIMDFRLKTTRIPKRLVMFRDGVSEGYFDEIKAVEYEAIRRVCDRLSPDQLIKITFVIVKKRHHTRLQPTNRRDGVGKFENVPPGTVVDTTIVHPSEQEFFLNSHVGIQGTSKPTRYHVIHDDNSYTLDQIQKMTYYMCYSFVRCTQPVSYPAATYYAHLAAYRARSLIERDGELADLAALQKQLTIHPDILKNYPMFFV